DRFVTILGNAGIWYDVAAVRSPYPEHARLWGSSHARPGHAISVVSPEPAWVVAGPYLPMPLTEPRHLASSNAKTPPVLQRDPWNRGAYLAEPPYDVLFAAFDRALEAALGTS